MRTRVGKAEFDSMGKLEAYLCGLLNATHEPYILDQVRRVVPLDREFHVQGASKLGDRVDSRTVRVEVITDSNPVG